MGSNNDWIGVPLTGSVMRPYNPYREALAILDGAEELASYLQSERNGLLLVLRRAPELAARGGLLTGEELGTPICHAFSELTDAFLSRLLVLACRRAGVDADAPPLALVATGGYGRRELCPFSDIDIAFVPLRDGDARIDRVVRDMFTQIMDICIGKCKLKVGYAYRPLQDCADLDHQTTTGLLDARLVAGSERLFIQFEDAFWQGFNPAEFVFAKLAERRNGLARWGYLPRVVEPQLKEGPGGLRDVQTTVWLMQGHAHLASARVRGARSLEALQREQGLTAEDTRLLGTAKETLLRVRNVLHALAGASRDTLTRTRQEEIATRLGYGRMTAHLNDSLDDAPPVERFMADLYPQLAHVRCIAANAMERAQNSRMMLGIGLDCRRGKIVPANGALETDDPLWLLWACELGQKYGLVFSARLAQACHDLLVMRPRLADARTGGQIFTRIVRNKRGVYPALQRMADLGILGWFMPEFGRVMDLIPYDPAHEYTVGQHTLNVLRYLDELGETEEKGESKKEKGLESAALSPFSFLLSPQMRGEMRQVMQGLGHPEELMLAALLHDCGKGLDGGQHADVGAGLARDVCGRLGWDERATANVVFLIEHHLLMAQTSRLRDLTLDETIGDFARIVNDPARLDMLYLLTYADTRAVGEGVWSQVNGRFLQELWRRTASVLGGEPTSADEERMARARRRMVKDRSLENLPPALVAEHIQAMPPPYLLNQSMEHIALHIGLVQRVRDGEIVIDFQDAGQATYTELTVAAFDDPRPGLLAKIAGVLYASDLAGHSAQVFTRVSAQDRIALDTLWVDFAGRQLSGGKRQEVASWLRATLKGETSVEELLARRDARRKLMGPFNPVFAGGRTRVLVARNDLSSTATVIEIEEPDVQGALFWTSQALSRLAWNIQSARVSLWHGAARASFYVTGARHLSEDEIRRDLTDALREPYK